MTILIITAVINRLFYDVINDNDRTNRRLECYYNNDNNIDTDEVEGLLAGSGASDEFRCEPCNKNLTSLTRLKRHIQNVHTRPSKEPICNICKRVYSSLNSLRNHKSIYHRQHNKSEQQRKEVAQVREWQRDQREHTERNYSAQQQQQQQHQAQQHPRMG
ncbi:hypothetical protein P5V15_006237 [Pogonomyrmex californicus]